MTLAVARSLANERALDPHMLLAELAGSFDPSRGYGRGTRRSIEAFRKGTPWNECAFATWAEGSAGNGSAARVAPIACRYHDDAEALVAAAALSSRTTHAHPNAITGAVLQAVATTVALQIAPDNFSPVDFLDRVSRYQVGGWATAKLDVLRKFVENSATPTQVVATLGNGVLAEQAVPAALWAFMHGAPCFERCVRAAATLGGDVDTICAMSGALAGALGGGSRLPAHWLANLAHERPGVEEIQEVACAFWRAGAAIRRRRGPR
jgi:poly(ADP-ribose) glycohydrolase ARH3